MTSFRVLVTGHLGYIGSVIMPMLGRRGYHVTGLDAGFFTPDGAPTLGRKVDIRCVGEEHLQGVEAIVHLAALSNDPMGQLNPALTDTINHCASVRLARLGRDAGVRRFVFASSCSLYGTADTCHLGDESTPFCPLSAYARSKVDAETAIRDLAFEGFTPVFLRNATVYGLSPAMRFDLVANNLVGWALTMGRIRLESDGSPWRPLVHVEDVARAVIAALEAPQDAVHNEAFNIGRDDQNLQIRDIAEIVRKAVPGCALEVAETAGPDRRSYRVSFSKATDRLPGFRARWDLEAGIRDMVEHYRRCGLRQEDFLGRPYVRLLQLRHLLETKQLDADLYWRPALGASES